MAELDATESGEAANSYLTLEQADQLMDLHLAADDWDALDDEVQKRALATGTRIIDRYKNWFPKKVDGQALAFPTKKDTGVPQQVKDALVEFCAYIAQGDIDHLKKLQAEGVTNASTLGGTATFKTDESELPAGARKHLDILWRRYGAPAFKASSPFCVDEGHLF